MRKRPGEGSFLVCGSYAQSTKNKKATDAKKLSRITERKRVRRNSCQIVVQVSATQLSTAH